MLILIVPEESRFGQPKYSKQNLKPFCVASVSAFIFFIPYFNLEIPRSPFPIPSFPVPHFSDSLA